MSRPAIFVLAGPNGAGKSTCAAQLLPQWLHVDQFVNADLIAKGLSPFAPESTAFAAGRIMRRRMNQLRTAGTSFAFETTLASLSYVRFLREAQALTYRVHLIFIALGSVDLALQRIRTRVLTGGHDVPREVVQRRFGRGLSNFFHLYQPLVDTWMLCDNSLDSLRVAASGVTNGEVVVNDASLYERIRRQGEHEHD